MRKTKVKKLLRLTVLTLTLGATLVSGVSTVKAAEDGIEKGYTYNYTYWEDIQYSPDAYNVAGVYTNAALKLPVGMKDPNGMYVHDKTVYICDSGNNRIIEVERVGIDEFEVVGYITEIKGDTDIKEFNNPTDITISDEGNIFIADKGNHRIVKLSPDLTYMMEFTKPTDQTFDQSIDFLPEKIVVDGSERIYCIAENVNKGLVKYERDGSFTGFSGASPVKYDWADYIQKKFATQAQKAALESFVPTEYDNIYRDTEGFIFACTTNVSEKGLKAGDDTPIRRLNLLGSDILIRNGNFDIIGDIYWDTAGGYEGPSLITDVTALDNGIYFGLDKTRGRVFGYDTQGNLLFAFGGAGNLDGCFKYPVAIEHIGNDLLVLDSQDCSFTLFTPTEYGKLIYKAIQEYDEGNYELSGDTWTQVMNLNGNYDLAYIGIGRSYMRQKRYKEAMDLFRLKWDTTHYSKAYKQYRKQWVEEHIRQIVIVILLVVVLPLLIGRIKRIRFEIDHADIFRS